MSTSSPLAPFAARAALSAIFIWSGLVKLFAASATQGYIASAGVPDPAIAYWVAIAVEAGGGLLLLACYRTRAVTPVLALFTIATALAFHTGFADQNQAIHFMKKIAIAGGLMAVYATGAGAWSVDAMTGRNRAALALA